MPTLKQANAARWANAKITRASTFASVAKKLVANKKRYQGIEAQTGVPWFVVAVAHQREASGDFKGVLHNGEKIVGTGRKTKLVPKGRGPFDSWEEAAIDALEECPPFAAKNKDWSIGGTLALLEKYNGMGYANKGLPSPYIWSGTDQYVSGKYVADHVYDAGAVDTQLGCAGLILAMQAIDKSITFGGSSVYVPTPIASVMTAPVPVSSEKPGIWGTLWRSLRGKDATVATVTEKDRPGMGLNGDNALYDLQAMLSDKGYVGVGQPDGLMGARTVGAIRAFRSENGLPAGDGIDAKFTAALAAAGPRQVAKARVEAKASDLRDKGNTQIAALDSFGLLGKVLGVGGVLGGINSSGVLDTATDTLKSAQDTLGTVTTVFTTIISIAQWCFSHWWMFALGGGVYIVFRVAMAVLNMVVMFRQGFLARADK